MFTKLIRNDQAMAENSLFSADEVQYNLFYRISEDSKSLCLKTPDGRMIFAQTPGHKGWLWFTKGVPAAERKTIIQALVSQLEGNSLPGITADPQTAELFAELFSKRNGVQCHIDMTMDSYVCPKVNKPKHVPGEIRRAGSEDVEIVAEYLAGFLEDAFGTSVEPSTQIAKAKTMIEAGNLYFWIVNGRQASMANISHRSPRHARINAVYTPVRRRKNGYASALVAELCVILEKENLIPMLYADISNPDSNKVYQNIGFLKSGRIVEIKFY